MLKREGLECLTRGLRSAFELGRGVERSCVRKVTG